MNPSWTTSVLALAALLVVLPLARRRLALSRAKAPGLVGHTRLARRVAALIPSLAYGEERFFNADGAAPEVVVRRRSGLQRLGAMLGQRHAASLALTRQAREHISDLQFTGAYRVPFPFSPYLSQHLGVGAFVQRSDGVTLTDLDGQVFHDLTGSYGVNVFGLDFYKECIAQGSARVAELGPALGSYHPLVAWCAERLCRLSGLDEVSFHMSGTEAVMQAVRLARYHTRRKFVVRFAGAYHGWWDDVQPGPGNPLAPGHTYTLKDMDEATLHVLDTRTDIACVLVNPLQALHPNRAAPADSALVDGGRSAHFDRLAYGAWLTRLRALCSARGIVFILDEVFLGFRLARGGAQEYFGIQADLVTYGKTLAGGLPVGALCGRRALMKRYREERPADICFARGTFNTHPYVMGAMQVFLERLDDASVRDLYVGQDALWDARAAQLNQHLRDAGVPVRAAHLGSVWTVLYTQPSRYHWMLQFYLRERGLALSWVGSGRLVFSLSTTQADFDAICAKFVAAALAMLADGWWSGPAGQSNRRIRRALLREMLQQRLGQRRS